MFYLIDGYNVLFAFEESSNSLEKQRDSLITYLSNKFKELNLKGQLVFDGAHRQDEVSGRSYSSPLETVFTPKGQSADSYIVEQTELVKNPKEILVITSDTGLKRRVRALKALTQPSRAFIRFLEKKSVPSIEEKKQTKENPKNLERLLKIFENRSKE